MPGPTYKVLGCDFGLPQEAGEQARKIILLEARKVGDGTYRIEANGRNARLCRDVCPDDTWPIDCPGWTLPELVGSLRADMSVRVAAFDFPFSIPLALLQDASFAEAIGRNTAFGTRLAFQQFLAGEIKMAFDNTDRQARLPGLSSFERWRDRNDQSRYWKSRATDKAARGQPPLKHVRQNLFNMTLGGIAMLDRLAQKSLKTKLHEQDQLSASRFAVETYPAAVARAVGFKGRYKQEPVACMTKARNWLESAGVTIEINAAIRRFCEDYRSSPDDPDGADAFLCLVTAIAVAENKVTWLSNGVDTQILDQEGCIVVPQSESNRRVTAAVEGVRRDVPDCPQSPYIARRTRRGRLSNDELRVEQQRYQAKYPGIHFVKDSLQNATGEPGDHFEKKRSIAFLCRTAGCGALRRVATSDLHNSRGYCQSHAGGEHS